MTPQITFLLGAGASKSFGLPLTADIFPRIWQKIEDKNFLDQEHRALLAQIIKCLYPGLKNDTPQDNLPGITELLSMVDHFIVSNAIPQVKMTVNDLVKVRGAIELAIIDVIEGEFDVPYDEDDEEGLLYQEFVGILSSFSKTHKVNIISTNYDIMIEFGLFHQTYHADEIAFRRDVDFGIRWRHPGNGEIINPPAAPKFSVYKLHGSTNWLRCDICSQTYINVYGSIYEQIKKKEPDLYNTCHCGHAILSSVIVSPSLEREIVDPNLGYIWNAALESLRTSGKWVIIGYSMPPEDLNIRSIVTRALNSHDQTPDITVVQWKNDSEARFRNMLGNLKFISGGMKAYITSVR
ncbi:MAG TPA: hypothetical protein VFZ52_06505 [Chryseolinea sp.]